MGDEQILEDWFNYLSDKAEERWTNSNYEEDKFDWEFDHDDSY